MYIQCVVFYSSIDYAVVSERARADPEPGHSGVSRWIGINNFTNFDIRVCTSRNAWPTWNASPALGIPRAFLGLCNGLLLVTASQSQLEDHAGRFGCTLFNLLFVLSLCSVGVSSVARKQGTHVRSKSGAAKSP